MTDLEETIRRLSASFAADIIAALRDVPLEELLALSFEDAELHDRRPVAPARTRRTRVRRSPPDPSNERGETRPPPEPGGEAPASSALDAAERVFAERGSRGATAIQLAEALAVQGVSQPDAAAEVIRVLVEREIIRDAGFRRTTGKGTAPVFVSCG